MPIGAAIASGVGLLGSVAGGLLGRKDIRKSSNAAKAEQQRIINMTQPTIDIGNAALNRIASPQALMDNFMESPDYQFRMKTGLDSVATNRAMQGLLRSGGHMKDAMRFSSNLAAGELMNHFNRERSIVDTGMQAMGYSAGAANQNSATERNRAELNLANTNQMMTGIGSAFGLGQAQAQQGTGG